MGDAGTEPQLGRSVSDFWPSLYWMVEVLLCNLVPHLMTS